MEAGRFETLHDKVQRYFDGTPVSFDSVTLDLRDATPFMQAAWQACRTIPRGETRTYKEVAESIGVPNGARAVANACGKNPFPITIPCHRVVRSDGSLGGYSGAGGVAKKRKLLDEELSGGMI